jgi:hypothetical protein
MPAEAEPIGSCGGAPGNEPAYPRPGAPAHETDPTRDGNKSPWINECARRSQQSMRTHTHSPWFGTALLLSLRYL